jgi:uncharacterized membrane protein
MKREIIAIVLLLILDGIWLTVYMGERYKLQVEAIQGSEMHVKVWSASLSYILMIVGLLVFVLPKTNKKTLLRDSILYGGLFGLVVYGIYDFTAGAVLKDWDMKLAIVDILWGGFVYTLSVYLSGLMA